MIDGLKPYPAMKDSGVPWLGEGRIEAFLRREGLPYVPDAWYDPEPVKIGYEVSFTHYSYTYQPPRPLEEIEVDIKKLEGEIIEMLREVAG